MNKILVVEDEHDIRQGIRLILENAGYCVTEASNGLEALLKLNKQKPNLIVSDIRMPKFNGYDLFSEIKCNPLTYNIPFLFLTAKPDVSDYYSKQFKIEHILHKPFKAVNLLMKVNDLLREAELRAAAN